MNLYYILTCSRERIKVDKIVDIFPRTEIPLKTTLTYSCEQKISQLYTQHQSDAIVPYRNDPIEECDWLHPTAEAVINLEGHTISNINGQSHWVYRLH